MAVLDDDAVTDLTPVEGGLWSSPGTGAARQRRDFQSLYEQNRARADAAETRCEELRQAEVSARSDAGYWKWHFKSCRRRLSEAEEETKELRRSVKEMPSLLAEVAHLRKLLWQATGPSEDGRVVSLRDEVAQVAQGPGGVGGPEGRRRAAHRRAAVPGARRTPSARCAKCPRPRRRGCSASGRACSSSCVPACARCTASRHGCRPRRPTVSPGTLADSLKRFAPLLLPVFEAPLAHQNEAVVRHADEASSRVQELRGEERPSRAWLWTSASNDAVCLHIDASRSAEATEKLFADVALYAVIVCDRYSAYKKSVRRLGGMVTLAVLLEPCSKGLYRLRSRSASAGAMVSGMDRADRRDLPVE